jgi:VHL beta domain
VNFKLFLLSLSLGITVECTVIPAIGISQPRPDKNLDFLKPLSCEKEFNLRSLNADRSTTIRLINRGSQTFKVYWIDYWGRRQHYWDLAPGEHYDQQTYVTHPWVITESGSDQPCRGIFQPQSKLGIISLP